MLISHHTFCSFFPHIQSSHAYTGGYYDPQQHQTVINVNPGFQESEHNPLRYTQGGPQGNSHHTLQLISLISCPYLIGLSMCCD